MNNFDWLKAILLTGMAVTLLLLVREWDEFQTTQTVSVASSETVSPSIPSSLSAESELPELTSSQDGNIADIPSAPVIEAQTTREPSGLIEVKTDVLDLLIDPRGGDIVSAKLPAFTLALDDPTPYTVLNPSADRLYIAQSGIIGANGTDTSEGRPLFSSDASTYELQEGQDQLQVDLYFNQNGVLITKRFILNRADYLITVDYLIDNQTNAPWSGAFYAQIKRTDFKPDVAGRLGVQPFLGAAVTTPDDRYKKLDFKDLEDSSFRATVDSGWAAMLQHYFLSAWIPDPQQPLTYDLRKSSSQNLYYIGFTQPTVNVTAGTEGSIHSQFYVGPKDQYRLEEIHPDLDLTVDYGWVWWAAQPLFWLLQKIHSFVGNWGISIILLTLVVKLAFFKLSATSYRSMARMRKMQPKMQALKERYADDKQTFSQEMMRLYQKEKVNPLGGCLPILVQMPVFIALYWVLLESVELRHAPFFGWIQDLSDKDPWFILPLIMGASMWLQMRLNPTPPDPTQAKVMQMMPIIFTFMFMWFPAGLVLYWSVNNILSMTQQWIITRKIEAAG